MYSVPRKSWKSEFWNRGKYKASWYLNENAHLNLHLMNSVTLKFIIVLSIVLKDFAKFTGNSYVESLKKTLAHWKLASLSYEVLHCATLSQQHHYDAGKRYHITTSPQSQYVIGLYRELNPTKNRCRHNIRCPQGNE